MVKTNEDQLADDALSAEKAMLDTEIKKLLSQKTILARILKKVVRECVAMQLNEIIQCIEGDPQITSRPVNPGKTNAEIAGSKEENSIRGEGTIYYDIVFLSEFPKKGTW